MTNGKRKGLRNGITRAYRVGRFVVYRETLVNPTELFWSFLGSFVGIGLIGWLHVRHFSGVEQIFLIGSFGASAVLVFGAIESPFSQPRNLIGGHLISAIVGVLVAKVFPSSIWLAAPLAVSLAILLMQITKTLHPPGGATALIAVIGSAQIQSLGFWYVISPVLSGALILMLVALVCNNMTRARKYPVKGRISARIKKVMSIGE